MPLGSKTKHLPRALRRKTVAASTSGFVEVETTAAGASRTEGITSEEVLPERGGPKMSMEPSGPA